ncbi:MAG: iron-sulfur cluster assembly accessory protein [Thermaerobacter sp.]|nr:iron-sulfur cluster assembly accessory protein [Thermaerobacter sp.]
MSIALTVTPAAERAFGDLAEDRGATLVRVWAGQACGCGRIGYKMALEDEANSEDALIPAGVIKLVVSPDSAPHLEGGIIDYSEDPMYAGFTINNPNAQSGCG